MPRTQYEAPIMDHFIGRLNAYWPERRAASRVPEPHPDQLPIMKLTATHELVTPNGEKVQQRVVYLYWFVADDELTARPGQRMWWMARDMLIAGVLHRWAYVACIS